MAKSKKPKVKDLKIIFNSGEAKDICICIDDFYLLRNNWESFGFESNTRRFDLKRGLYGEVETNNIKIWVSKSVPQGYIRIYPKDKEPQTSSDSEWSIDIKISDFEKVIKLKAFW